MIFIKEKWSEVLLRASEWAVLLGIALFVWRKNAFTDFGVYAPSIKPSDPLFALAILLFFCALLLDRRLFSRIRSLLKLPWTLPLLFFFSFAGVATIYAAISFPGVHAADFWGSWSRVMLGVLASAVVAFFGFSKDGFLKNASCMFLSSLGLSILLFLPMETVFGWFLVVSPKSYALLATHTSPLFLGTYLVIPLALVSARFYLEEGRLKILWGACASLLFALVIWTSSRSGLLAGAASLVFPMIVIEVKKMDIHRLVRNAGSAAAAAALSVVLLSPLARDTALSRVFPNIGGEPQPLALTDLASSSMWEDRISRMDVGFWKSRGEVWRGHLQNAWNHPLGVGMNYASIFENRNEYGQRVNAHSLWIELLVVSGFGGFLSMAYLFFHMAKSGWEKVIREATALNVGLYSAWVGLLIATTFVDALELRWFWILTALLIVMIGRHNTKHENPL